MASTHTLYLKLRFNAVYKCFILLFLCYVMFAGLNVTIRLFINRLEGAENLIAFLLLYQAIIVICSQSSANALLIVDINLELQQLYYYLEFMPVCLFACLLACLSIYAVCHSLCASCSFSNSDFILNCFFYSFISFAHKSSFH